MLHWCCIRSAKNLPLDRRRDGGVLIRLVEQMAVSVEGDLDRRVAHPALYPLGIDPLLNP